MDNKPASIYNECIIGSVPMANQDVKINTSTTRSAFRSFLEKHRTRERYAWFAAAAVDLILKNPRC